MKITPGDKERLLGAVAERSKKWKPAPPPSVPPSTEGHAGASTAGASAAAGASPESATTTRCAIPACAMCGLRDPDMLYSPRDIDDGESARDAGWDAMEV